MRRNVFSVTIECLRSGQTVESVDGSDVEAFREGSYNS